MGIWISVVAFLVLNALLKIDKSFKNNIPVQMRYRYRVWRDIGIYLCEIMVMYGVFTLLISNPFYKLEYAEIERSYLKVFIDFFTLYQIAVVVILKLISSHYVRECRQIMSMLNSIKVDVEADIPLNKTIQKLNNLSSYHPGELVELLNEVRESLVDYEHIKDKDSVQSKTSKILLMSYLTKSEILVNSYSESNESEWEVSLFLKVIMSK